jgi:hypothetical protein
MKRLIVASLALALLSGCAGMGGLQVGPRAGESPCAYGRRVMDETQRRLDQARAAAEVTCTIVEQRP